MTATGADGETGFNHLLWAKELEQGEPVTSYYRKAFYPKTDMTVFSTLGNKDIEWFQAKSSDDLFGIALTARKVGP